MEYRLCVLRRALERTRLPPPLGYSAAFAATALVLRADCRDAVFPPRRLGLSGRLRSTSWRREARDSVTLRLARHRALAKGAVGVSGTRRD